MTHESQAVRLSPLDEMRFGIVTARADDVTERSLPQIQQFCSDNGVVLLIARCDARDQVVTFSLQGLGALLTETAIDFRHDVVKVVQPASPSGIALRLGSAADEDGLTAVARASFGALPGHYHSDPRLDPELCREVYVDWIRRTITTQGSDGFVVVAEEPGSVCGFLAGRMVSAAEGLLFIGAVSPAARGKGVFRVLAAQAAWVVKSRGGREVTGATQLTNYPVQSGFVSAGYRPYRAYHTFHKWFD